MTEVDTDLLKVLLHPLLLAEVEAVQQADAEVEDPEDDEISQNTLVDAAFPEEKQSEEGSTPASVDVVDVGHRHPQQPRSRGVLLLSEIEIEIFTTLSVQIQARQTQGRIIVLYTETSTPHLEVSASGGRLIKNSKLQLS